MVQQHLSYKEMTDNGCFYTPKKFVLKTIELIQKNIVNHDEYTYLDSSCGYGAFLSLLPTNKTIGCDIDNTAIEYAKSLSPKSTFYNTNTLYDFSRNTIGLNTQDKLIIIGNPPYNDFTSKVKNEIKNNSLCEMDKDIKTRDLGISFLLSYNKLAPDFVAVLHPLAYMIKKANYNLLKPFYKNYSLIDHCIINSQEFSLTSKSNGFPIIIALYKLDKNGMSYEQIMNMTFKTIHNTLFDFKLDFVRNYISKYPSHNKSPNENDILFFTMRDINALNRSRTFIEEYSANSIIIDKDKLAYYCYVDVFKQYIKKLPYYYGNIDVFINHNEFLKIKDIFINNSIERHPWLLRKNISFNKNNNYSLIDNYFKNLFNFKTKDFIKK